MLIFLEGIFLCFVLLVVCVVGLKNGPECFVTFYEKDVQERVVELGYTTKEKIKRSSLISNVVIFVSMLVLVPLLVYSLNNVGGFAGAFWQMSAIYWISGLFDRLFIDWFWVEHTKVWFIPKTEDLMPYIPRKTLIKKWVSTIIGAPLLAACIAGLLSLF